MSIIGHIFILLFLLMLSGDIAAIAGHRAQILKLPASSLATLTPLLVFSVYVLSEFLAVMRRRSARWIQSLVLIPIIIYPAVIYQGFSFSIQTPGSLSSIELQRFKKQFGVPVVMQSTEVTFEVTVAKRDFRPEMVEWLSKNAATVRKEP